MVPLFDEEGEANPELIESGMVDTTHNRTRRTTGGHLCYDKKAMLAVVASYVRRKNLTEGMPRGIVRVDDLLCDALFKGTKKRVRWPIPGM